MATFRAYILVVISTLFLLVEPLVVPQIQKDHDSQAGMITRQGMKSIFINFLFFSHIVNDSQENLRQEPGSRL